MSAPKDGGSAGIEKFAWGPIEDIHEIGEYYIVEFHPQVFKNSAGTGEYHKHTNFHPYIEGKDIHQSFETLDTALIGAIAHKHDGLNSQAASYFFRMIGIDKREAKG